MQKISCVARSVVKRVIFSAGGTGGHLFPAQAAARQLLPHAEVIFMGSGLADNAFFDAHSFCYHDVEAASLEFSWTLPQRSLKICRGIYRASALLATLNPDLVVGFGSFHTLPTLLAARLRRLPILLHEQNAWPGRVNRLFAPSALQTAITFPQAASRLRGKSQLVQFPLRQHAQQDPWSYFGWSPGQKTLLICGGSQGAAALNATLLQCAPHLTEYRLIHLLGGKGDVEQTKHLYRKLGITAIVKGFEPRIDLAMQVAHCAICRAGAATISELIAYATPAILIPYPHARDQHQMHNAMHFVQQIGGGTLLLERNLDDKTLIMALSQLDQEECRRHLSLYHRQHDAVPFETLLLNHL